jgi:ABC-2 type transport system permease protein
MNTFKWLLKREYWEHRGGFFWAPIVSGAIFLLLTVMAIIAGESVRRASDDGGSSLTMNGVELERLTETLSAKELAEMGGGLDLGTLMSGTWPFIVLGFVVFFYCLGALFDERKDRSVLFWKSLPLSDGRTVLSKVASALVLAPVIATLAAVVTSLGFLVVLSVYAMFHGGNPLTLIWGPASPLSIAFHLIAALPVYAAWALPTVGWLLLVSAWARSKPFLWALLVPVFAGVLVTWFDVMQLFGLKSGWFWQHIVGRSLLGTFPGMDLVYRGATDPAMQNFNPDGPQDIVQLFSAQNAWASFATPDLWIGVVAGALMIFGAIHFRRSRDEG